MSTGLPPASKSGEWVFLGLGQKQWFTFFRILLGAVWAVNVYFQLHTAYLDGLLESLKAAAAGKPPWLSGYILAIARFVELVGPRAFAVFTVVVSAALALSLITGVLLKAFSWVGIAYALFIWSTLESFGAPYGQGSTDPGNSIVYAISFTLMLLTRPWESGSLVVPRRARVSPPASPPEPAGSPVPARYAVGRILFGCLWLFDAFWKWHPYFLTHFTVFFTEQIGAHHQAWVTAWLRFVLGAITFVGPGLVAVLAALVETVLAVSLITGLFMEVTLPLGALFTFVLWCTAEGFGGPYIEGIGTQPAALLGTAIIYTGAFLYLIVMYRLYGPRQRAARAAQG